MTMEVFANWLRTLQKRCIHIYIDTYIYTIHIYIYIYIYIYKCVYIYVYIYIYTHLLQRLHLAEQLINTQLLLGRAPTCLCGYQHLLLRTLELLLNTPDVLLHTSKLLLRALVLVL